MKKTHKQKVKLARKMMTNKETRDKVNIFDSAEWNKRKEARQKKLIIKDDKGKKHKVGEIFESKIITLEN